MRELYTIDRKTLEGIRDVQTNHVLVKIDDPNEYRKTKGGIYIWVDPTECGDRVKADNADRHGIVQKVCKRLFFDPEDPGTKSLEFDVDIEVKEGDRVWFNYLDGLNCVEFHCEGVTYKLLKYDSLVLVKNESGIKTLNGYVLVEPIYEKEKTFLYMDKKKDVTKGKVAYIGTPNKRYRTPGISDDPRVKVGHTVVIRQKYEVNLEDKLHRFLDGDYRLVRGCDICGILN